MKLTDFRMRNFRCFEDLQLRLEDDLVVLVANNGQGKSSILDAIALAFGPFLSQLPGATGKDLKPKDLLIKNDGKSAPFQALAARVRVSGKSIEWTRFSKRDPSKFTAHQIEDEIRAEQKATNESIGYDLSQSRTRLEEIKDYAESFIQHEHLDLNDQNLPILAYYGTGRGVFSVPERRRGFQKDFERFDAYRGCLDPSTNFKQFFEYFYFLEDLENRQIKERRNFDFKNSELETIRKAISSFLEDFENPRTELRPLRFLLDQRAEKGIKTLDIRSFSDGYRTALGVIMDLASRMARANPHLGTEALMSEGVVMIDEIDMHLHPEWQQRIIGDFRRTFPKVQLICSTHSPQVLSTVSNKCIRVINEDQSITTPGEQTQGTSSHRILSATMNVDPTPDLQQANQISELKALIQKGMAESIRALELRNELEGHFGGNHPEIKECDRLVRLDKFKKTITNKD